MKKRKTGRFAALLAAGAMVLGGFFTSCSFFDSDDSSSTNTTQNSGGGSPGVLTDGGLTTSRKSISAPEETGTITLYKNGVSQGTKTDLAAAFSEIPQSGSDKYSITLEKGTYNVTGLTIKTSNSITIRGLGSDEYGLDVLIYGQGSDMSKESLRSTLSFQGSCNVVLKNLTVQNSYGTTTGTAQAEALGIGPTAFSGTLAAYNCSFLSGQDTICTEGKAWFYKCYVEGDVDFLWIESRSSRVALYEECVLRAIGSRTTKAYFAAPRLAVANTVGKGVVIFNSTLEAESGLKEVYLGRNPWDKENDTKKGTNYFEDYYENIAVVGSTYNGPALNSAIWSGSGAHGTDNQQFVGFKTDTHFSASSNTSNGSAQLTSEQVSAEYSDRNVILNRVYNITAASFENDSKIWDVTELESEFSAGSSEELPTTEFNAANAKVVWNFAGTLNGESTTTQYQSNSGTIKGTIDNYDGADYSVLMHVNATNGKLSARSNNGDTQINSGTILTVPATKGAIISITKNSSGTFGIEEEETTTYTYQGDATGIIIYCTGSGYITEVSVSNLDLTALSAEILSATATGEVRAVRASPSTATVMQGDTQTLTAVKYSSYGYDADSESVSWSSSNDSVATVSNGTVTGVASSGSATITATCNGHSGSCEITAAAAATTFDVTWDLTKWSNLQLYSDEALTQTITEINGKTGYVIGSSAKAPLYVDATIGKFSNNGSCVQVNKGTKIYVPVSSASIVTVTAYSGYQDKFSVSANAMTLQTHEYSVDKDGYILIEATENGYLNKIITTNVNTSITRSIDSLATATPK